MEIAAKRSRLVIGLMSGTSADGVDSVLARIDGAGERSRVEVLGWATTPYPPELRDEVLAVSSGARSDAGRVAELSFRLARVFADAAVEICGRVGADPSEVDLIGSHGQTVFHRPPGREPDATPCTLQLGEPCVIAERTGVTTVADFRPRDMAAGGQGAPLVPLVDYILFRSDEKSRCMLNLGGIANITWLPRGCAREEVLAFDTGPGNMVLDSLAHTFSGGERRFDEGGALALSGKPHGALLGKLLAHPYFKLAPPKSTGREEFGEKFAAKILRQGGRLGLSEAEIMATAVGLTTEAVALACREHLTSGAPADEVVASGGGVRNEALMNALRSSLAPARVVSSDDLGVPADAKEAVAFAVLANETVSGNPGNLTSVTGAERAAVLGKIVPWE